jgi:tetratricopeptide (TPR) repeat protein
MFMKRENFSAAEKSFSQLVKIEDSARAWAGLAEIYYTTERLEAARDAYLDSILRCESEPQLSFEIHKNLGNVFVKMGDFEMAEDFYNKAHTINPSSDVLAVNYGTLALQKGDQSKAVLKFRQALQLNTSNDKAWVGLALVHQQYGDHELAWANLQMAIEKNPFNKTALLMLAQWSHRDGTHQRAVQALINFVNEQEYDEQISALLIETLIQIGNYQMAKLEIERAICWNPESEIISRLSYAIRDAGL